MLELFDVPPNGRLRHLQRVGERVEVRRAAGGEQFLQARVAFDDQHARLLDPRRGFGSIVQLPFGNTTVSSFREPPGLAKRVNSVARLTHPLSRARSV